MLRIVDEIVYWFMSRFSSVKHAMSAWMAAIDSHITGHVPLVISARISVLYLLVQYSNGNKHET